MVVVESPTKANTIQRILGDQYKVYASQGHIRDLPKNGLAVDVLNGFKPTWDWTDEKHQAIANKLQHEAKTASSVVLATDMDREGEAIAWHLAEILQVDPTTQCRAVFHELTPRAIKEAFAQRRALDADRVDAQFARRILDRLVGYEVSALLWRKVRRGLSAGRVQTVALRLIVEREREIKAFIPVEYWYIDADLAATRKPEDRFTARLKTKNGKNIGDRNITTKDEADALVADMQKAAYSVESITEKGQEQKMSGPYETSTLQSDASNKLNFPNKRTMSVAQSLYEGVQIGSGREGLITYMRTDSLSVAPEAQKEAKELIKEIWGEEYVPAKYNVFDAKKSKKGDKVAVKPQEAHECIRPTSVRNTPSKMKGYLNDDQYRLYKLIWQRFMASQMTPAKFNVRTVLIKAEVDPKLRYGLRTAVKQLIFPGWKAAWGIKSDEQAKQEQKQLEQEEGAAKDEDMAAGKLPLDLKEGEPCDLFAITPSQHYTEPPPHYTEATITSTLKELGIGRPSTYVSIINTVVSRLYVEKQGKALLSTMTGETTCDFLVEQFPEVFNTDFTAKMEEELDDVAEGDLKSVIMLTRFWGPMVKKLGVAAKSAPTAHPMELLGRPCPMCGKEMAKKAGIYGEFIGCTGYTADPPCKYIEKPDKLPTVSTNVPCPECGKDIVERHRKKDRSLFFGCSGFPKCHYLMNDRPVDEKCPTCGHLLGLRGEEQVKLCPTCAPKPKRKAKGSTVADEPPVDGGPGTDVLPVQTSAAAEELPAQADTASGAA